MPYDAHGALIYIPFQFCPFYVALYFYTCQNLKKNVQNKVNFHKSTEQTCEYLLPQNLVAVNVGKSNFNLDILLLAFSS